MVQERLSPGPRLTLTSVESSVHQSLHSLPKSIFEGNKQARGLLELYLSRNLVVAGKTQEQSTEDRRVEVANGKFGKGIQQAEESLSPEIRQQVARLASALIDPVAEGGSTMQKITDRVGMIHTSAKDIFLVDGKETVLVPNTPFSLATESSISQNMSAQLAAQLREKVQPTREDVAEFVSSGVFTGTVKSLRQELIGLGSALQQSGEITPQQAAQLGIEEISISSVGKKDGAVDTAMVTFKMKTAMPKRENGKKVDGSDDKTEFGVETVFQKVELRLHEDEKVIEKEEKDGQVLLRVGRDKAGRAVLLPKGNQGVSENASQLFYTSFGGSNQRTRIYEVSTGIEEGEFLTPAQIVESTDDLVLATLAMQYAKPSDVPALVQAFKARQAKEQSREVKTKPVEMIYGQGTLPEGIRDFAPFEQILGELSDEYPDAVGLVVDHLTLGKQSQPLFAEVLGVITRENGKLVIHSIPAKLARKASVVAGFYANQDGEETMATVEELRAAVGGFGEQAIAGSTGDQGTASFQEIILKELGEEAGAVLRDSSNLQLVASYSANDHTTEDLALFVVPNGTRVKESPAGTDAGESTRPHNRPLSEAVGSPRDAKTAFLSYYGRLHLAQQMTEQEYDRRKKNNGGPEVNPPKDNLDWRFLGSFPEWQERVLAHDPQKPRHWTIRIPEDSRIAEFGGMSNWRERLHARAAQEFPNEQQADIAYDPTVSGRGAADIARESQMLIMGGVPMLVLDRETQGRISLMETRLLPLGAAMNGRELIVHVGEPDESINLSDPQEEIARTKYLVNRDLEYLEQICSSRVLRIRRESSVDGAIDEAITARKLLLRDQHAEISGTYDLELVRRDAGQTIQPQIALVGSSVLEERESLKQTIQGVGIESGAIVDTYREDWDPRIHYQEELRTIDTSLVKMVYVGKSLGAPATAALAATLAGLGDTYAVIYISPDTNSTILETFRSHLSELVKGNPDFARNIRVVTNMEDAAQCAKVVLDKHVQQSK